MNSILTANYTPLQTAKITNKALVRTSFGNNLSKLPKNIVAAAATTAKKGVVEKIIDHLVPPVIRFVKKHGLCGKLGFNYCPLEVGYNKYKGIK